MSNRERLIENATRVELFLKKGWIEKYLHMNLSLKRCCESLTVFQAFQSAILLLLNLQKQPTDVFYKKKLFLKISKYSQGNTNKGVFLWILRNF